MDKWGIINQFDDIFIEQYSNDTLAEYQFVVEVNTLYGDGKGNGTKRLKYFNKQGQLEKIFKNDWYAVPIVDAPYGWGGVNCVIVDIYDKNGVLKKINSCEFTYDKRGHINYVLFLFGLLDECSKYYDWQHYDIFKENIELKKKVEELEERIEELENESE